MTTSERNAVAVVLAGGRGTRSADPTRAKLAQEVGGASLMQWHLRLIEPSEIDEALVVAGHLGDQVELLCDELHHEGIKVRVIHEAHQHGTMAALRLAAEHTDAEHFLVILGDILMSLPLQQFLDEWRAAEVKVAVAVHPSTHPEDSDAAFPSHDGSVMVIPKSQQREHVPNMSSAGLFAITRAGIAEYGQSLDLGSDVLLAAANGNDLFAFVSSHYLKDTGTPSRLAAARMDVANGSFRRRGELDARPVLFLDRDGVLNPTQPEVYDPSDFTLMPGVAEEIAAVNGLGIPVIVVTNQPGLAKGFMDEETHQRIRARMDRLLAEGGAFVDDYFYCPHHPEAGWEGEVASLKVVCKCRKPKTELARRASHRHRIDLVRSVMVGDSDLDRDFASAAGMRFIHVAPAHEPIEGEDCVVESAEAIRLGVEVLTC